MTRRRCLLGLAVLAAAAAAGPAAADNAALESAVASIDAGDASAVIAGLRPRIAELDAGERCALGLAYAKTGAAKRAPKLDRARALIYLPSCGGSLPTAIAERAEAARDALVALAGKAGDARVEIVTGGLDGLPIDIDRLAGDRVLGPATLWLPAGDYKFTAHLPDNSLLVTQHSVARRTPATVLFEPGPITPPDAPPPIQKLDFSDGEPDAGATYAGPPPKHEHGSMIRDKFSLKENLDVAEPTVARASWAIRNAFGLRAGGGVVDSSAGGATGALSVAAQARAVIAGDWFAGELRVDVGPRGSDAARVWTIGVAGQARWYPAERTALRGLSVALGGRAEIRTTDSIEMVPVERFGVGATTGIGWEPGTKRFAVELRGEQALSSLAGGRPHVVLLELGFNL
jgi:hypothetical protein